MKQIIDNNLNATECNRQIVNNTLREHLDFHMSQLRDYMSLPSLKKRDKQVKHNVTLWRVRATIFAVENK